MNSFSKFINSHKIIIGLNFFQYLAILGLVFGVIPQEWVWVNMVLSLGYVLVSGVYSGILFTILNIPFFLAVPNQYFDAFQTWRLMFAIIFAKWFLKSFFEAESLKVYWQNIKGNFFVWDKYLGLFVLISFFTTVFFAQFKIQGLKQIIFWLNIYILYIVIANIVKTKEHVVEIVKYSVWALTVIVTLGFAQLFGSFLTDLDTFWVFWASFLTKLFYGQDFASVALYSNSWFSYTAGRELRMFSVMPDSQSFAYMCVFGIGMGVALVSVVTERIKKLLWSGIRFASLAVILSGTRAVWVGMFVPFFVTVYLYAKKFMRPQAKVFLWPFVVIIILFAVSPFINQGLSFIRASGMFQENFLSRAKSIYDLNETSNSGRLVIWKDSLVFASKHPWGVGSSNFIYSLYPEKGLDYLRLSEKINERYNLPQKYVSAHSLYLHVFVETGVLGLLALLYAFLKFFKYNFDFLKKYSEQKNFLVMFVLQSCLVVLWILGASVFDVTLFNDKVLMFFFLTLALSGIIVRNYEKFSNE